MQINSGYIPNAISCKSEAHCSFANHLRVTKGMCKVLPTTILICLTIRKCLKHFLPDSSYLHIGAFIWWWQVWERAGDLGLMDNKIFIFQEIDFQLMFSKLTSGFHEQIIDIKQKLSFVFVLINFEKCFGYYLQIITSGPLSLWNFRNSD